MNEQIEKLNQIATDVLRLSRNTLLVNLRFLDMSLSMLQYVPYDGKIATDGQHYFYDVKHVLESYRNDKNQPVRDYLHLILHCVFRHMFVSPSLNTELWDLACDIAVENVISELNISCVACDRENAQQSILTDLATKISMLSAEKIYNYLSANPPGESSLKKMQTAFCIDDHSFWYDYDGSQAASALQNDPSSNSQEQNGQGSSQPKNGKDGNGDEIDGDNGESDGSQQQLAAERASLEEQWQDISERMQTELESFAKVQGDSAGGLMQNLKEVNREKYDYTAFLKKFATLGEAMVINDDEFDYIFYTYGLQLYKKMPLIEPLEYKDVKRIKEFVIAIDTSGSVQGDLVQSFLQKTYNILKSTESFFSKINLHIVQCDAEIQQDTKISSQEEFDQFITEMKLFGFGGTDFRPVFEYVDQMIENHEFTNLKGLIYFTDGCGTFPSHKPNYDVAFVFVEENKWNNYDVPPWAIKLILREEEI